MLKWAATFAINRLMILGIALLGLQILGRNSCGFGLSVTDRVAQIFPGLQQISRALQ